MRRRRFLGQLSVVAGCVRHGTCFSGTTVAAELPGPAAWLDSGLASVWLKRWTEHFRAVSRDRYCDRELGEELGWLVSPFLNGAYYGYCATQDPQWLGVLVDWADACLRRGTRAPDGHLGWPKGDGGGGDSAEFDADSLLGEAMLLRPLVRFAGLVRSQPALQSRWAEPAQRYLDLAEATFQKWDSRDCWRRFGDGGLWVVPAFGILRATGKWSAGYDRRRESGFSNPTNKQNHIARWLLALGDVTGKPVYRQRAESWFRLMKSRIRFRESGKHWVWNYWDPAGAWDYRPDGTPRHWVGVHPNGGYYGIDVEGMVDAFEHQTVFSREDLLRLVATNRDGMWNQDRKAPAFSRIDRGEVDPRWKQSPGVLWTALLPYDATLRELFVAAHDPTSWGGLAATPWFLARAAGREAH